MVFAMIQQKETVDNLWEQWYNVAYGTGLPAVRAKEVLLFKWHLFCLFYEKVKGIHKRSK